MTPETEYDLHLTPEYTLAVAIIHRAHEDLRAHAPPHERASSIQFFKQPVSPLRNVVQPHGSGL